MNTSRPSSLTTGFDEIVESIMVDSSEQLTFKLIGGITLTEQIPKKGR